MKKLTTISALALVAMSVVTTAAMAQDVSTNDTDLILGFRVTTTGTTGASYNLEVDLGSASLFTTTAHFNLSGLLSATDLETFGTSWGTRTDLSWGAVGAIDDQSNTNDFVATYSGSTSPVSGTANTLSTPNSDIQGVADGLANELQADLPTVSIVANASSDANSYVYNLTQGGTVNADYQYFNAGATQKQGTADGTLKLYAFNAGSPGSLATELGTITLSGTGSSESLIYNGINAVPEPSSYALGALSALVLFFAMKRRRSNV